MWIESHQSLRNHPKVKKAARIAGVSECEMIGLLHYLWWWSMDYAPDGDLTKYTDDDIEDAVDWKGERGLFVKSLIECSFNGNSGLIDVGAKKARKIHDWYEYAGKLIERRAEDAERKRNARRKPSAGHPQDGEETAHVPNQPTIPNQQDKPQDADKPRTPEKETCPKSWVDRINALCKIDASTVTVPTRKNVSDCGKALIKGGAVIEALDTFERNWYALDWRGKQGQPPTVKQVRDEWGKYSAPLSGNGHTQPVDQDRQAALAKAFR